MPLPTTLLPEKLQQLWETRAGRALRKVGLGSVRTTIFTLAVLATLIPALATSWISYRQNSRALEAKLNEQLASASTQSAREIGLWLKERLYDLKVFAASYEVTENVERGGGGSQRLPDYLNSVNERFPDFDELMVVAPDLRTVAHTGTAVGPLRFTGTWLQRAREGDAIIGDPQRTDSAGRVSMEVAVPIQNAAGRFLGVLAAQLNFTGIQQPVRDLVAGEDGRLLVVRSDGEAIVSIGRALAPMPEPTLRSLEEAEGDMVAYDAADGVGVLGVIARVPGTEWMVVAEIPASTAYSEMRQQRNTTVLLVLVLLLVVGSLGYLLGLLIVLPLERLARAADQVAGGDLDVNVPVSGSGEVSQLTGVFNDMVRRLRDGRAELERLSVTDDLTGLANRRQLDDELAREVQRSERHAHPFAVLMLDVDKFKVFNDTHGHPAGDAVLEQLARILRESAREVDTAARYGGEEFFLILPETSVAGAAHIAERIRASTEAHPFAIDGGAAEVKVTVSIGYAIFPDHGRTPDALIEAADQALYRSKQGGRNRATVAG
ncbi:MAG: diguanylate cyclase [Gemmatimonadetes bacterium]|nr:diguanylate cyclase [Gemmatimonadota bacterium]